MSSERDVAWTKEPLHIDSRCDTAIRLGDDGNVVASTGGYFNNRRDSEELAAEQVGIAKRIVALWNNALGIPTSELQSLAIENKRLREALEGLDKYVRDIRHGATFADSMRAAIRNTIQQALAKGGE